MPPTINALNQPPHDATITQSALTRRAVFLVGAFALMMSVCIVAAAQSQKSRGASPPVATTAVAPPLLKRTTTRRETRRLGYGGTLTFYGAPDGSITVEAWARNEVEVTADLELQAATEDDLARLAAINNFTLDADGSHLTLLTSGTHDRKLLKRVAKDFPKRLLGLPWKIDYRVRVPAMIDLDLYAGRGALNVAGVEGAIYINAGVGAAMFTLGGGDLSATCAGGTVRLRVPTRNWRGRGVNLRLVSGDLSLELPPDFNADIDATVLRAGRVINDYAGLRPRDDEPSDARALHARAGGGGTTLKFEVGDGTIRISQASADKP